jgi:hypothetical protein
MQKFYIVKSFRIKEEINCGIFQFLEDAIEYVENKKFTEDSIFYHIEKHTLSKPDTCEIVHSSLILNTDFT